MLPESSCSCDAFTFLPPRSQQLWLSHALCTPVYSHARLHTPPSPQPHSQDTLTHRNTTPPTLVTLPMSRCWRDVKLPPTAVGYLLYPKHRWTQPPPPTMIKRDAVTQPANSCGTIPPVPEIWPAVPEPAASQASSREQHSDQTTQSSAHSELPGVSPPTRELTYDTLSFASLNVGGVEITLNRLCHILTGSSPLPHTLSLQEFCPSALLHITDHCRVARFLGYHLVSSSPSSKDGVALLIHTSIAPTCPKPTVHIPSKLISVQLTLHHSPLSPHVRVASFNGPHTIRDKRTVEPVLDTLLKDNWILLGDYNGVTQSGNATALRPILWPWLIARERSRALSDLLVPHCQSTPYTRVRRYGGTKSYIDRGYGTRPFCAVFQSTAASELNLSSVNGAQDQDPIVLHTVPWSTSKSAPPTLCPVEPP